MTKISLTLLLAFIANIMLSQTTGQKQYGIDIPDNLSDTNNLPVHYDLRGTGRLSPVKTQPDGGCWASATMAAVESAFRTFGYCNCELSDINLKLFHGFDPARSTNGNHYMSTAYFSRRSGPLLKGKENDSTLTENPETAAYITGARFLPGNPAIIKKVIMKLGAVYSMMYYYGGNLDTTTNIYYQSKKKINHAITLVGWDDTISTKTGTGVWIAQNSLGKTKGDSGFIYIPYSDPNLLKYNAVWNKWIPYNPNTGILYYDTLGAYDSYGYNDSLIYGLVIFNAPANCKITKLGTAITHGNTTVSAEVHKTFDPATGTLSGLQAILPEKKCRFPGYYTFDIPPVHLKKGEELIIVMKYVAPGEALPMPVEKYIKGYSNPVLTKGKCFINHNPDKWPEAWYETGENSKYDFLKFNLCIKAYYETDK